jgi:toxin ParE1/3/4
LLQLPTLRSWPLTRFPYLVFYMETPHEIDVLHVLHGSMDLPEWLDH